VSRHFDGNGVSRGVLKFGNDARMAHDGRWNSVAVAAARGVEKTAAPSAFRARLGSCSQLPGCLSNA
jgi:hypothetical protein